jgi:hypothetical protein
MIMWKCLPGILYQTESVGKRARQQRDRERVCVLEVKHCREREMATATKYTIREKHMVQM